MTLTRRRFVGAAALTAVTAAGLITAPSAFADGGGGGNPPPFDFTDAYYRANGIDPAGLVGRRNGSDGISVFATPPDGNHRNVRSLFTLPGYDTSGGEWFFTVLADLGPNAFLPGSAGAAALALAEASPVYVFPTLTGNPLSPGNSRQADMINLSGGYFSHNPLGLWVHIFVTWSSSALNSADGQKTLADLARKNGTSLDGTPIIKSQSDLDDLTKKGYAIQTKKPTTANGRYFVCPVLKDPRRGAIARDAILAAVFRSDGTPLPAEQFFVTDFNALKTTGDYPH